MSCPRCLDPVVTSHKWTCGRCDAVHHADCAVRHGSCAVVGCFSASLERQRLGRDAGGSALARLGRLIFS